MLHSIHFHSSAKWQQQLCNHSEPQSFILRVQSGLYCRVILLYYFHLSFVFTQTCMHRHTHIHTHFIWMKSRYFAAQIFFHLKFEPTNRKLYGWGKNSKIYQDTAFLSCAQASTCVCVLISLWVTCIYTAAHTTRFAVAIGRRDKTIYSFACFICRVS